MQRIREYKWIKASVTCFTISVCVLFSLSYNNNNEWCKDNRLFYLFTPLPPQDCIVQFPSQHTARLQMVSVMSGEDLRFLSGPGHFVVTDWTIKIAIIAQKGLPTRLCIGLELKNGECEFQAGESLACLCL